MVEVRQLLSGRLARFAFWVAPLLAIGIASQLSVSPAQAHHIPGATYTGTHSGGGTVEFTVSADGTRIESFRMTNVPSGQCTVNEASSRPGALVPIAADHTFAFEEGGSLGSFFRGAFPSTGTAAGTLKATPIPAQLACLTFASQTWTATTSATPAPSQSAGSRPYFRGGHDSVKLVRSRLGTRGVSVRAKFRACGGTPPFRLVVRQRRRVGTAVVAESSFRKALTSGRPASEGCRDYTVNWRLTTKFYGAGYVVVTLLIVDAAGEESGAPRYALRAPKR